MCSAERRWSLPLRRNLIALRDMEEKALHSGALPGMRVGARLRPSGPRVSPLPSALAECERRLTLLLGDITGPSAGVGSGAAACYSSTTRDTAAHDERSGRCGVGPSEAEDTKSAVHPMYGTDVAAGSM